MKMKAMVATQFGDPDVLNLQEVEKPQPGPGQLLVKIQATSINPVDYKIRQRGKQLGLEPPLILGFDAAGIVEETGPGTDDFKPGDEVFYVADIGDAQGCNAEYHVVDECVVVPKPENLSPEEAAAIPLAGSTAWQALMVRGGLYLGENVLIHGAGGVGSFAAQIAVAAGARVFVSCRDYMLDQARDWGVERAIDCSREDFVEVVLDATAGEGASIVFDTVGGDLLPRSVPAASDFGTLVGILDPEGAFEGAYRKNLTVELVFLQRERESLLALRRLVRRNLIHPVIDSVIDLPDLAKAHRRVENGGVQGKVVVRINE